MKNLFQQLKQSSIFNTLKHGNNYFIANIAVKAVSFITLPIFTRVLSPDEYGIVNLFSGYIGIFYVLSTLGLCSSIYRYYFDKNTDFKSFFGTNLISVSILFSIFSAIVVVFHNELERLLNLPITENLAFFYIPIVLAEIGGTYYENVFSARMESKKIMIRRIIQAYATAAVTIAFVFILKEKKYYASIYGTVLIGALILGVYIFSLRKHIRFAFNVKYFGQGFAYSIPLVPEMLASYLFYQISRIFLSNVSGYADTGFFSFVLNISVLSSIFFSSLLMAWQPQYFDYLNKKDYAAISAKTKSLFRIILSFNLLYAAFGYLGALILGSEKYLKEINLMPVIILAYSFSTVFSFSMMNVHYSKKTVFSLVLSACSFMLNIVLNALLIGGFRSTGAALSFLLTYFLLMVIALAINALFLKIYAISLKTILFFFLPLLAYLALFYGYVFFIPNIAIRETCKIATGIAFCLFLFRHKLFRIRTT